MPCLDDNFQISHLRIDQYAGLHDNIGEAGLTECDGWENLKHCKNKDAITHRETPANPTEDKGMKKVILH